MGGETYTLERMVELMHRLGDPQNKLRIIHIAGSSGKTSTAYFVRGLLEAAGQKTGLTVSPHITSITERVQIGGQPLDEPQFVQYFNQFVAKLSTWPDLKMSYFELLIAFAYWVFEQEKVDYAVIETGLGGRLDATNVVNQTEKICVLTPISLDHTSVLGSTVDKIATEKAGIIHEYNTVIVAKQASDAQQSIDSRCRDMQAQIVPLATVVTPSHLPQFQAENWQIARTVHSYITQRDSLPQVPVEQLEDVSHQTPPGRFERYYMQGKTIILDGAHNPQKLAGLQSSLPDSFRHGSLWLVALIDSDDTRVQQCCEKLASIDAAFMCTEFQAGQDIKDRHSVPALELAEQLKPRQVEVVPNPVEALERALKRPEQQVVITGSLYLVAQLRSHIRQAAMPLVQ